MTTTRRAGVHRLAVIILFSLLAAGATMAAASHTVTALKDSSSLTYHMSHPLHEFNSTSHDVLCTAEIDDSSMAITHTSFTADVTSFDSGNSNRDSHAMEALDAIDYPTVSYESSSITGPPSDLVVRGTLTFHGQAKPLTVHAVREDRGGRIVIRGTSDVSLTAFGIDRPSLMMIPVRDTMNVSFQMEFPISGK